MFKKQKEVEKIKQEYPIGSKLGAMDSTDDDTFDGNTIKELEEIFSQKELDFNDENTIKEIEESLLQEVEQEAMGYNIHSF